MNAAPASFSADGVSPRKTRASAVEPTGSPSRLIDTKAAGSHFNAQLYVEWAISWGTSASSANHP